MNKIIDSQLQFVTHVNTTTEFTVLQSTGTYPLARILCGQVVLLYLVPHTAGSQEVSL
jgi:hypothetical protein